MTQLCDPTSEPATLFEQFDRDGFLMFGQVLPDEMITALRAALDPHMTKTGRNNFEGTKTQRVYALLAKHPVFAELCTHPLALQFAERDLGRDCLLSACLAINLGPGETVQPWHTDDGHITLPRPRANTGISVFWALDAMTAENGATELLPGSHLWAEDQVPGNGLDSRDFHTQDNAHYEPENDPANIVKALLPAGGMMITKGTLWHRGGANESGAHRLIITPQYCAGWARPLENMSLAVPPHKARDLPERAQELLGYSIAGAFMGYVDGMHPKRLLA